MKKNILFLLFLSLTSVMLYGQCRILHSISDMYTKIDDSKMIVSIESKGLLSKYIAVTYSNGDRTLVYKKNIWGYIDTNNQIWRCVGKECYQVVNYNSYWVEYTCNRFKSIIARQGESPYYSMILYSKNFTSKLRSNWIDVIND